MREYRFIAGLPRSGSTLLTGLLNQHPKIYSGPTSPMCDTLRQVGGNILPNNEFWKANPKDGVASNILYGIIDGYYSDIDAEIIVDKSRGWMTGPDIFGALELEHPKIVLTVRSFDEIITSFLKVIDKSLKSADGTRLNFVDKALAMNDLPMTDENRIKHMISGKGVVGRASDGLRKAMEVLNPEHYMIVEYNDLVSNNQQTMDKIFEFYGVESIEINSNEVEAYPENDYQVYGVEGLHDIRKKVENTADDPKDWIPQELLEEIQSGKFEFWREIDGV